MELTTKTAEIAKILIERGETVAVGESSAGGLVSASLLAVPGASKYFMGGGVIYTHRARKRLAQIDFDDHSDIRSSSEPYASLLAESMRGRLSATGASLKQGQRGQRAIDTVTLRGIPVSQLPVRSRMYGPLRRPQPIARQICGRLPMKRSTSSSSA